MGNDIFIRSLPYTIIISLTHNNIIIKNNLGWPQMIYEWNQLIESTYYLNITLSIYDIKYNWPNAILINNLLYYFYLNLYGHWEGKKMICESVALPDLGARTIKYPLAKRNLGRRHRRHLCHHIINHWTKNPYPPLLGALYVLVYFHLRPIYHLCTSGKNR